MPRQLLRHGHSVLHGQRLPGLRWGQHLSSWSGPQSSCSHTGLGAPDRCWALGRGLLARSSALGLEAAGQACLPCGRVCRPWPWPPANMSAASQTWRMRGPCAQPRPHYTPTAAWPWHQYRTRQCVGCSHMSSWSPQKRLYVVLGSKPRISRSSWMRKENVETEVPMNTLETRHGQGHRGPAQLLPAPWGLHRDPQTVGQPLPHIQGAPGTGCSLLPRLA